jgi:excisionase family DNA binding protein
MKKEINERVEPQQERKFIEDLSLGFLNVHDIAGYLKLRTSTVYSLVEKRAIPYYRVGRQIRFWKEDIDQWMTERKEEAIDTRVEADKVVRSVERKSNLDIKKILKEVVDEVKGKRYTGSNGKPDQTRGLGKEVEHGSL